MRTAQNLWTVLGVAASTLLWAACGATSAENRAAEDGAREAAREQGFLQRIFQPAAEPIVVPAGTHLTLTLEDTLSSHETPVGASFTARVVQEVSIGGRVAVPAGSLVWGRVTEASPARKIGGRARLSVAFDELEVDGERVAIAARLARLGKSERAKDAAIIGGSTIGGAILGEAIDDGDGDVVGAIVGGVAGTIGALKTRGKPVVLAAGSTLHIALESSVTVDATS